MTHPLAKLIAALALVVVPTTASAQAILTASIAKASGADSGWSLETRLGTALAQVGSAAATHVINLGDCETIKGLTNANVDIDWQYTNYTGIGTTPNYAVKMAPPGQSCVDTDFAWTTSDKDGGCISVKNKTQLPFAGSSYSTTTTIDLKALLGTTECSALGETTATVSFIVDDPNGARTGTSVPTGVGMVFTVDTAGPPAPTVGSVSAGNENLKVSWTVADDSTTPFSRVYWSKIPFTANKPSEATNRSDKLTGASFQITGLTNGETYYVAVTGIDSNDNESVADKVVEASPLPVQDMWQYYKASGGAAEGGYYGCSAGPARSAGHGALPMLLLLLACGLVFRRLRARSQTVPVHTAVSSHRAKGALAAVLAAGLVGGVATQAEAASPRTMSLDARFTYYQPGIDTEFSKTTGATPYADIMKDPALQWGASVDWRLWHGFGEIGAGFSVGYWTQTGKAQGYDGSPSEDETELMVVPITIDLVYRFNFLAEKYNFPLVPYAKGGLAYGLWWAMDGTGETSSYTGPDNKVYNGSGGVAGFHGTVGLRLLLDVFEPKAARGFDLEMGVNHSYLFVEYQRLSLTNFGDAKALDLSSDLVVFGLAFDL